jgi:predicted NBD/HSP70 family sugar kinase
MGETGLSRTAVTQLLRMLESGGAVASAGVHRTNQGPAATRVSLNPGLACAAAVHLDHHSMHVAVVDPTGAIRAERQAPFDPTAHLAERVGSVADALASATASAEGPLSTVVIGVPGIVTRDGGIRDDQGPDGGVFRSSLSAMLKCDVRIENDVNLAAVAELSGGAAAGFDSFALLVLDDGLGAGIIIDGRLHRGASGVAGEVQYLPQPPLPIAAPVLSDVVIADLALAEGLDPQAPAIAHLEAAADGDPAAQRVVAEMASRLVLIGGSMTLVLDPDAFLLAGLAAHPAMVEAVQTAAEAYANLLPMSFVVSSFGREATLVGAIGEATAALRDTLFTRTVTALDRRHR